MAYTYHFINRQLTMMKGYFGTIIKNKHNKSTVFFKILTFAELKPLDV